MKAINRFKKITAALALIAAVGLDNPMHKRLPKKWKRKPKSLNKK